VLRPQQSPLLNALDPRPTLGAPLFDVRQSAANNYDFLNGRIKEPDWALLYPREWAAAEAEARRLELGTPEAARFLSRRIGEIRAVHGGRTVLIGGPPCQAYSLVGRSRNAGRLDYVPENDQRNFLYEQSQAKEAR
jgi:DNA (cytosine-5)-methyltransferase 1